jgi:apolipoprotein N-acyltransferase
MQAPVIGAESDLAIASTTSPQPAPAKVKPPVRLRWLGLAVLSGFGLWLCHFPVAWGWLAWVALVPVLALTRVQTHGWWLFLCAWCAGLVYYVPAISWMGVAHPAMVACWLILAVYCALYFPLALWLVRRLQRGMPLPLMITFPTVWTALEFFRAFFGTGFSFYLLSHTQHDALAVIQIADLGGSFAVSFLIALVNVVVFEGTMRVAGVRHFLGLPSEPELSLRGYLMHVASAVVLLTATVVYGVWCLGYDEYERGPRLALLQANLDQRLRIQADLSHEAKARVQVVYGDLSYSASQLQPRPELIVWPETSYPMRWGTAAAHIDLAKHPAFARRLAEVQDGVRIAGRIAKTNVLLGINTDVIDYDNKFYRYNSALLLDAQGNDLKRYDKVHRVPFGEYIPFKDWLPIMNVFSPYGDYDYSIRVGEGLTRFTLGKYRFGVLICYEDTDPALARDYGVATADGPPVDFLLNISNDGWFNGTAEHEEHLAISRFRAIESRRALARAVNMGVSAVIDSSGRVLAPVKRQLPGGTQVWSIPVDAKDRQPLPIGQWHEYKQTGGILEVDIPIDRRTSVYAMLGDWLPYSCWGLMGVGLAWGWTRQRIGQR